MRLGIGLFFLVFTQISCFNDVGTERVKEYLLKNYEIESNKHLDLGKKYFIVKGYTPYVKTIETPVLDSKTNHQFYKAVMNNTLSVSPRSTIIIASPDSDSENIFEINSIIDLSTNPSFKNIFNGKSFLEINDKEDLAKDIAKLVTVFFPDAKIHNLEKTDHEIKILFWKKDKKFKTMIFSFLKNELSQIELSD